MAKCEVDIDAVVSDVLLDGIRSAGGTVISSFPTDNAIRAILPQENILRSRPTRRYPVHCSCGEKSMTRYRQCHFARRRCTPLRPSLCDRMAPPVWEQGSSALRTSIDDTQGWFAAAKASCDCLVYLTALPASGWQQGKEKALPCSYWRITFRSECDSISPQVGAVMR